VSGVPGKWDVWVDPSDPLCISYVASDPIDGLTFDLNNFIQDSVTKQYGHHHLNVLEHYLRRLRGLGGGRWPPMQAVLRTGELERRGKRWFLTQFPLFDFDHF